MLTRFAVATAALAAALALPGLAAARTQTAPPHAAASSAPAASSVPAAVPAARATFPPENPAVTARAREWLHRLQTGQIDRTQLTPKLSAFLSDTVVQNAVTHLKPLGEPASFRYLGSRSNGTYTLYAYRATFKTAVYTEIFTLDNAGKIAGLGLHRTH